MSVGAKQSKARFFKVIWKALTLNATFYENARDTPKTYRRSLTIVILAAISHILGSAIILLINRATLPILIAALLLDGIGVVLGYYFWTLTITKIGDWLKPNHVSYRELLIPIGYAYAPQVLNFLTLIPLLGRPIELVLSVWSLLAVIVAVRQGLDISNRTAILICLVGWPLIQIAIGSIQILEQYLTNFRNW